MAQKNYARTALVVLSLLNFFNYVDRSVLFAVQPLVQAEFKRSDAEFGFLTTAFFICYMVSAPIVGWFADRYPRKLIMVGGAVVWSIATLLTAVTFNFDELLLRHTIVGIGEATFVTIAPSFLADMFPEHQRGRIFGIFYLNIGLGTAAGYMLGGYLGHWFGWRMPFYIGAVPGLLLALALWFIPEPQRGASDHLQRTQERGTLLGLTRNGAFWTATLGMAMVTFALGGLSVWMPTFLSRVRNVPLSEANLIFGGITAFNAVVATLFGGWLGDRALEKTAGGYYLVSGVSMLIGIPAMVLAVYTAGPLMYPAMFAAEFLLFLNNAPLNAAVVNSVSAAIRASAIAVNLFTIHLLGDAFSPTLIGYISDRSTLQRGFIATFVAIAVGVGVLIWGMRFAPEIPAKKAAEVHAG